MNQKCIYYVEGPCEQQLISALKENPAKLIPGKIKVFNVVQNLIPKSQMLTIQSGTTVVIAFDTDVPQTEILRKNVELLKRYCSRLRIIFMPQVLNLEDELTRSNGIKNFKADFCRLKVKDCRAMLERHKLESEQLWMEKVPEEFSFVESNSGQIKIN